MYLKVDFQHNCVDNPPRLTTSNERKLLIKVMKSFEHDIL